MDAEAPAAAQISQADIIERQAESIARLKRQVHKGVEYKQLTKSKLKEAAVRLKEYRVRVETLLGEVETLLGEVETLKKQLEEEKDGHVKTKKQHKKALKQIKAIKQQSHAATQTPEPNTVTRTSQTLLSGQVERMKKRTMRDQGVQTLDMVVDTLISRKRGRERGVSTLSNEEDQFVPKLLRRPQKDTMEDTFVHKPLQSMEETTCLQETSTTFLQETSAALDAELALSESEDESGETGDNFKVENGETGDILKVESGGEQNFGLNPTVLDEIDKELEMSSGGEEHSSGAALVSGNGHALLGGVERAADNNDSGRIGGRNGIAAGEKPAVSADFDFAISNAIDKDLESSSDEEDSVTVGHVTNAKTAKQRDAAKEDVADVSQSKWTLMSIDDELDDEFAALEAGSDTEKHRKAEGSRSSGSSSENDTSDSSDSDSGDAKDDPKTGEVDNVAENESLGPVEKKDKVEITALQAKKDSEPGVLCPSPIDKDAVVLTTPVEKKFVGALEDAYSLVVDAKLTIPSSERMQLDTSAKLMISTKDKNTSSVAVDSHASSIHKSVLCCSQPSGNIIDDAGYTAAPDTQTSWDDTKPAKIPMPKQSTLATSSSSTNKPIELELDPTINSKQPSDPTSLNFPGTPLGSTKQNAQTDRAGKQVSSILPAIEVSTIGKFRKADEANLEYPQAASHKKIKLNDASGQAEAGTRIAVPHIKSSTTYKKKKSAVTAKANEKLRLKKSLSAFKQAVVLSKGEEHDKAYTRRTIAVLVNQCSKFVDTHLDHVITLCRALADAYRERGIFPMLVVRGSLSLFRTPRSRRLMQDSKMGLSWLCNQVLTRVVCIGNKELDRDGSVAPKSFCLSMVDECLLHLRGLLVEERTSIGEFLSENRVQVQVSARQINVSHDKVFLAHICALFTHLCRSTGQLVRSRVLLFDLVRDNPNIRGLYFAMVMLEIYPAILEREFDQYCIERQVVLKETLQQALVVISGIAAAKQELLLLQSSITMLHVIADALQMPELEKVDGSDFSFQCTCVEKLFNKLVILCQSPKSEQQADEVRSSVSADYFALAKSMEICTAVYGVDLVMKIFNIERCQELFSKASVEDKVGIMHLVGHIAMGIASKANDMRESRSRSEVYIETVIDWMCHVLSTDGNASPEDRSRLTSGCSTMCVELILECSVATSLKSRRRVLCAVVRWFDAMPSDQLINLPATFLRRLRLAVVAARPQMLPR